MSLRSAKLRALAVAAGFFVAGTAVHATDLNLAAWVQQIKMSGDFRVRQESFMNETAGNGQRGRSRQRMRLRIAAELPLPYGFTVKTRFATGTGEQVSTNQSFDNLSNQKGLWVDRAYLEWKTLGNSLTLTGGRMANPLWIIYASDILWDDDFNPEGFAQGYEKLLGPVKVFANALEMVVDEDAGNQGDQWEVTGQIGAEFRLPLESRLKFALSQHEWINETTTTHRNARGDFGQGNTFPTFPSTAQNGNRRGTGNTLLNEFRVQELSAQLSFWILRLPASIQGTFIKNVDARDALNTPDKQDTGYQIGGILGKASLAKTWEAAYFMKRSETDSTVADVADSDFGNGGTGRKGSIMWIAFNPQDWLQLKAKYFMTKILEPSLNGSTNMGLANNLEYDLNRLQVDLVVKF